MKVLAISCEGQEYLYKAETAHEVSARSAQMICDRLNELRYKLREGQIWFVHEVGRWDNAYIYAEMQKFKVYKNNIREVRI